METNFTASPPSSASAMNIEDNPIASFMRHFVTSVLPYMVVFGSVMLKVPQIITILRHSSATGISIISIMLDLVSCVISTSWGIAQALEFKDFGENLFVMVEVIILLLLIGYYQKNLFLAFSVLAVLMAALVSLSSGQVPRDTHKWLLGIQIVIGLCSRVPQILMNFKNRATGQLSFVSFYLAMVGGSSRLLTTFHNVPAEKGRQMLLTQFGVSVGLNALVLTQIIAYKKNTEENIRREKAEQEKAKMTANQQKGKKAQ